jgi:glycerophosphoryl diester phosphodiesterase
MKRIICLGLFAMLLTMVVNAQINEKYKFVFKLHGQTRNYDVCITEKQDTIRFEWSVLRNFNWQKGCYKMGRLNIEEGNSLSWLQPVDGCEVALPANETFGFISRKAWKSLKEKGWFVYNGTTYRKVAEESAKEQMYKGKKTIHVLADVDLTNMWIIDNENLPLIYKTSDNPLEIDWTVE